MRESTECLNKQLQGPHYTETSGHSRTNKCEENDFPSDASENISDASLSYVDSSKLIQEIDEIQELSPNFDYNTEVNQNVSNYINENTNDAFNVNALDIDAIIDKRFNEIMIENNFRTVASTEQGYEQQNIDTAVNGKESSKERYNFKETPAKNGRSVETYATLIQNALNDALLNMSEATKLNYKKILALKYKIEVEMKRKASDVEIEIKNVPVEDVLSEFLDFNKSNNSVEASKENNASNNNIGEEKNKANDNSVKVIPTKKYKCDWCHSEFAYKKDATQHVTEKHGTYKCPECGFAASDTNRLKIHILRRHTNETPYACHLCSYTSRRKDMLKRHFLTHNTNKPYICKTCNTKFKSMEILKRHSIKNKCALNRCKFCRMQFTSVTQLFHHTKTHDYDSPYICSVCGWQYKTKHGFSRHEKTHNTYET